MLRQIINLKTEFGGATGRNNKNNESRKKTCKSDAFYLNAFMTLFIIFADFL